MGTQESKSKTKHKKNKKSKREEDYEDTSLNYSHQKTETEEKEKDSESTSKASETSSTSEKRVRVVFKWRGTGNDVRVTGDFLSWTTYLKLTKNPRTDFFEVMSFLPLGTYQFKFVIDGSWKFSPDYTTIQDERGNIYNLIDLTNYKEDKTEQEIQKQQKINEMKEKQQNEQKRREFNCYFPKKYEFNEFAPRIPFHYSTRYNINYNTRQNKLGKGKFLNYQEKNLLSENDSYKRILVCPHVNLNHVCSSCSNVNADGLKLNYVRVCDSQRIRHKYVTLIYYKPLKSKIKV